jgi:hypothetical protein
MIALSRIWFKAVDAQSKAAWANHIETAIQLWLLATALQPFLQANEIR